MADIIQTRRDTAVNWTTTDPILANGEIGLETDTNSMKVGNGVDSWTVLPYFFITVKTFLDLTDTPLDYTGQALKSVLVKATEDGLEFGESGGGVFVGPVPPTDKVVTPIWFNTNTGKTLTWYEDADSKQWVQDVALAEPTNIVYSPKKNYIINPTFFVNQRGFTGGIEVNGFSVDRWRLSGTGTASLPDINGFITLAGTTPGNFQQRVEIDTVPAGTTMTVSWEGTAQAGEYNSEGKLWQNFKSSPFTFVTKLGFAGSIAIIGFNNGTVKNLKLETGSVATSFEYPDLATELSKCQRYYCYGAYYWSGYVNDVGEVLNCHIPYPSHLQGIPVINLAEIQSNGVDNAGTREQITKDAYTMSLTGLAIGGNKYMYVNWTADAEI